MIDYDEIFKKIGAPAERKDIKPFNKLALATDKQITDFHIEIVQSKLGIDKVGEIIKQAEGFIVETDDEARKGLEIALSARKHSKEISKLRKEITRPATDFRKEAIKIEKDFTDKLSTVESELLEKIEIYQEQRKAAMEANDIIDVSFDTLNVDLGSSSVKSYFEFHIENFDEIPYEYLKLDEKKLNQAIKDGIRNVPGVKIVKIEKKQYRLNGRKK